MHVYEKNLLLLMKILQFFTCLNNVTKPFLFCKKVHDLKRSDLKLNNLKGPKIKVLMLLGLCFNF
jgi:hypothetical protein